MDFAKNSKTNTKHTHKKSAKKKYYDLRTFQHIILMHTTKYGKICMLVLKKIACLYVSSSRIKIDSHMSSIQTVTKVIERTPPKEEPEEIQNTQLRV